MRSRSKVITIWLSEGMISTIDVIVGVNNEYANRSEFIRAAVHLLIVLEVVKDQDLVHVSERLLKEAQKEARLEKQRGATLEI